MGDPEETGPIPPAHLRPYVDVLGVDGAVDFLLEFGGAELYLSSTPKGRSRLAEFVGLEKAAKLAVASNRMPRRVPTGKQWVAAVMKSKGLSVAEIARKLHSSDVAVRGWLKKFGMPRSYDHRQGKLPL